MLFYPPTLAAAGVEPLDPAHVADGCALAYLVDHGTNRLTLLAVRIPSLYELLALLAALEDCRGAAAVLALPHGRLLDASALMHAAERRTDPQQVALELLRAQLTGRSGQPRLIARGTRARHARATLLAIGREPEALRVRVSTRD